MTELIAELESWICNHSSNLRTHYRVPLLGEGGTCSLFGELDPTPFDLTQHLTSSQLKLLAPVQAIVDWVHSKTAVEWFGIYLKRTINDQESVLTKLAYFGAESRAEFPVDESFAAISNNSYVGLYGQKRTINNVAQYVAEGGEYYTCDPKVKSELCWPILSPNNLTNGNKVTGGENHIVGIIDAESFTIDSFKDDELEIYEAVCHVLAKLFTEPEF